MTEINVTIKYHRTVVQVKPWIGTGVAENVFNDFMVNHSFIFRDEKYTATYVEIVTVM